MPQGLLVRIRRATGTGGKLALEPGGSAGSVGGVGAAERQEPLSNGFCLIFLSHAQWQGFSVCGCSGFCRVPGSLVVACCCPHAPELESALRVPGKGLRPVLKTPTGCSKKLRLFRVTEDC
jgi:hypothetical protein